MLHKELGQNAPLRKHAQLSRNGFTGKKPYLHTYAQPCHETLQELDFKLQTSERNETGCISSYLVIMWYFVDTNSQKAMHKLKGFDSM